ncbi:MAG: hypothetical protein GYA51_10370 [Candidatus Methanofastidiosa archaeon]|jgi:hypothetical protein|nr:hypothetical protein [Candidatus Methanofastidiosa archaeon]
MHQKTNPINIGLGNKITMKSMHVISRLNSKHNSAKLRFTFHYLILAIFFISICGKYQLIRFKRTSSRLKLVLLEVISCIHR